MGTDDVVDEIRRQMKREVQRMLSGVFVRHAGHPVAEVRAALEREGITEPELSEIAVAISDGREPKVA